jgi:hypothetical protein
MFHLSKTIQLSTKIVTRGFHTTQPVFLFGSGVIQVKDEFIYI